MASRFSISELEAFLDESLPVERMTAIEDALRADEELQKRLAAINGRRDAGVHSLGEIWRRHRLSCPSREQLPAGCFAAGRGRLREVSSRNDRMPLLRSQPGRLEGEAIGR